MNIEHFFYFNSSSAPYWFNYGLNSDIDFLQPSEKERIAIKSILMDRVVLSGECWLFANSSSKKANLKISNLSFSSKKIYYETFNQKIESKYFSISASCGNINCVAPTHLTLFLGRSYPFWARKNLRKPKDGMGYCQNIQCKKYSEEIPCSILRQYRNVFLCDFCFKERDSRIKDNKSEYDIRYSEQNREKIKKRYKNWLITKSGKISIISSSQNRRDYGLRKINKDFISKLIDEYNSCCYCGRIQKEISNHPAGIAKLNIEHIIPILGKEERGNNNDDNIEIACWECNSMKKNLSINRWLNNIKKRMSFTFDQTRTDCYEKIIETLSEEKFYIDGKFIPRHMRKQ
jgi:hypothetical protein